MKTGDIIYRKDIPYFRYKIAGESSLPEWGAWIVESVGKEKGILHNGMVFKDDDRWTVLSLTNTPNKENK